MSDLLREAAKDIAKYFYGENAEISELQILFAMTEIYKMKKECAKYPVPTIVHGLSIDIYQVAADLEQEIDKEMPGPESPEYNRYLGMKALAYNLRGQKNEETPHTMPQPHELKHQFFYKTVELLESIKLEPVAVYPYVDALNLFACYFLSCSNPQKAIEHLKVAENTYEMFKNRVTDVVKDAMTPYQIFGVQRDIKTFWCLMTAHHYTSIFLYICYQTLNNEEMTLQYVMPSIRAKISIFLTRDNGVYIINNVMTHLVDEIELLIKKCHFAQVNHLLAAFMNNLVKYRRSLPEIQRSKVNVAQGLVSLCFAHWAFVILNYSFIKLTGNPTKDEANGEYYAFEGLIEPGIEIYEFQLPYEQIQTYKELKKTFKKGVAWCKRAMDLLANTTYSTNAKFMMEKLEDIESSLDIFAELK